jgi:hypothetical protein
MIETLGVGTPAVESNGAAVPEQWLGRYVAAPSRFETFHYLDVLGDSIALESVAGGVSLTAFGAEPRPLLGLGEILYRVPDRSTASHVLLAGEDGERYLSDGFRTLRRVGVVWFAAVWTSFALGVTGLVFFFVAIPLRRVLRNEPLWQPASVALLLLAAPVPLFLTQSFVALGDLTPASMAVYVATLALPLLMLAQAAWVVRCRSRLAWWPAHLTAAMLVLQWCVSLYAFDMLPFALWR